MEDCKKKEALASVIRKKITILFKSKLKIELYLIK
jgi:hypothetical protein